MPLKIKLPNFFEIIPFSNKLKLNPNYEDVRKKSSLEWLGKFRENYYEYNIAYFAALICPNSNLEQLTLMMEFCNILWILDETGSDHGELKSQQYLEMWRKIVEDVNVEVKTPLEEALKE